MGQEWCLIMNNNLQEYLDLYKDMFLYIDIKEVDHVIEYLRNFKHDVYVIGNGGSIALAQHFAQDLVKKCGIPSVSLTNISNLTAFSNDHDYMYCFSDQIKVYAKKEDCLISFSSSGNSMNIVYASVSAKVYEMKTISFTGFSGGILQSSSDMNIHIPCYDYGIVESIHSILFHYIIDQLTLDKTDVL